MVKMPLRERKDPCSIPHLTYGLYTFLLDFGDYNIPFPFYLILLYYYKIHIIGIDCFTVFYYIKYNLVILTGVPRISFDM